MSYFIINPGTDPCERSLRRYADASIRKFARDLGLPPSLPKRDGEQDEEEGLFPYKIKVGRRSVRIDIPGWDWKRLRYMGKPQCCGDFPRLYVDGSSYWWIYALSIAAEWLKIKNPNPYKVPPEFASHRFRIVVHE